MKLLTRRQYAEHRKKNGLVGSTYQTVCVKCRQGKITCVKGMIDPAQADSEWDRNTDVTKYKVDEQPKKVNKDTGAEIPAYQVSKARIEATKAILIELDLREKQGELVKVSEIGDALFDVITVLKQNMMLIPQRIGPELASLSSIEDVDNCIEQAIVEVLTQLSEQISRNDILKGD